MKLLFIFLCLCVLAFASLYPYVYKQKLCYDQTNIQIHQINLNVPSRGWTLSQVCEKRLDVLIELQECLQLATGAGSIRQPFSDLVTRAVFIIRPFTKSLSRLTMEHNEECRDFIRFQLE